MNNKKFVKATTLYYQYPDLIVKRIQNVKMVKLINMTWHWEVEHTEPLETRLFDIIKKNKCREIIISPS